MAAPVFVFDIETIPDLAAMRRVLGDLAAEDEAVLAAYDDKVKPALQQVVAIAGAWISPVGELVRLRALGTPTASERELVEEFFTVVTRHQPRLAGWNTRGFDLPVLIYRAMVHHIATPRFYAVGEPWRGYRYRYDEEGHIDLMDLLANYGASTWLRLHEMAAVLGIPGKSGVDGSQVWDLYRAGRLDVIRSYCEADVLTTALIYGRYAEHRGWFSEAQAASFAASVRRFLDGVSGEQWDAFRKWVGQ